MTGDCYQVDKANRAMGHDRFLALSPRLQPQTA